MDCTTISIITELSTKEQKPEQHIIIAQDATQYFMSATNPNTVNMEKEKKEFLINWCIKWGLIAASIIALVYVISAGKE